MTERIGRCIYALEALVIGLPTLAFAIPTVLLGVVSGAVMLSAETEMAFADWSLAGVGSVALYLLVLLGGVSGLAAWFVLSARYLTEGRKGLHEAEHELWFALAAGILTASVMLCVLGWEDIATLRWGWFLGPALVVPSLHLVLLRLRSRR